MKGNYVLEVLNPRAKREHYGDIQGLTAPRLDCIEGKKIAILVCLPESVVFSRDLARIMQEKYPTATIECRQVTINGEANLPMLIEQKFDAYIDGIRLSGGWETEPPAVYEKAGIPGVHLCMSTMYRQATFSFESHGIPTIRAVQIPAMTWINAENKPENYSAIAEMMLPEIVKALTDPLTEEEMHPAPDTFDYCNLFFEGEDYDDAYAKFNAYFTENAFNDGLPVVPPTPERVKAMLAGTTRDPQEVIKGVMQPGRGVVTIEKIAVNAVMAGAKPEYFPVIIAAVEGVCDPGFLAWHALAAINSNHILIAVNGPIAKEIGMSGRGAFLGPGNPVNNTIGRAVSLCELNCGWIEYETHGGMYGQPSRFCNLIFCENTELSPWDEYHVSRGFAPEDSTVVVEEIFFIDGLVEMGPDQMPSGLWTRGFEGDMENTIFKLCGKGKLGLERLAEANKGKTAVRTDGFVGPSGVAPLINGTSYMLALYPGQAKQLYDAGYTTRESLLKYIAETKSVEWEAFSEEQQAEIMEIAKSGNFPNLTVENCKPGGRIPAINTNKIAIFVVGHLSGETLGFHSMGSYGGRFASQPAQIKPFDSCFNIKKITGATLTKAGR